MGNVLDTVLGGLNEAAFGDVRNLFSDEFNNELMGRRIGLVANSYDFMAEHLRRNIGNSAHHYDGYGTPIGLHADPFYNSIVRPPSFILDAYKNSTANYIDYMREVYGASLSVSNIDEYHDLRIVGDASSVGAIQTAILSESIKSNGNIPENVSLINPNGLYSDTELGRMGTYYVSQTLYNATSFNDARKINGNINGITDNLSSYFGMNSEALENGTALGISSHNKGESYLSNGYYDSGVKSPVYESNYGNYDKLGPVYQDYFNSLGEDSKFHFWENIYGRGKTYYPEVEETKIDEETNETVTKSKIESKTYIKSLGITPGLETLYNDDNINIRYIFKTSEEQSNISHADGTVYVYTEKEGDYATDIYGNSFNYGTRFGTYTSYSNALSTNDLLKKTNDAFKRGKYDTLIARFHTHSDKADITDTTQTAISKEFGVSHGRNLLKTTPDDSQGYDNPYCRVWTFHHQYHRLADAIRPFQEGGENGNIMITQEELYSKYGFNEFSADNAEKGFENGRVRLGKYGVTNQRNGLVNISPVDSGDPNKKVDIRNCMFSIENLAWKGSWSSADSERETFQNGGLSSEQKGPFGGRIMWFPPYGLRFNETVTAHWDENNFIGRGESIYTYKNTTRTGTLSFKLLIDHPSILNYWENKGRSTSNSVDDKDDPEQQLLRFFAGCEMLSSKRAETKKIEVAVEDPPIPYPNTEIYTFFVFFPNDYSGIDNLNDDDFVVDYLTNGIGTWVTKTPYSIGGVTTFTDANNKYHPDYSKLSILLDEDGSETNNTYGGYEMRAGKGISYVKAQTNNNRICIAKYGEQIGETIFAQEGPSGEHDYDCKWYYRVDDSLADEILNKKNYIDSSSNGLNTYAGIETVAKNHNITDKSKLFSFADAFVALTEDKKNSAEVLSDVIKDKTGLELARKIFKDKNKIKQIICTGQASQVGKDVKNKALSMNRAKTVKTWLQKYTNLSNITATSINSAGNAGDVNSIIEKVHRCTRVDIYVSTEASMTAQDAEKDAFRRNDDEKHPTRPNYPNNTGLLDPIHLDDSANIYYDEGTRKRKETYAKLSTFAKSVDYLTYNVKNSIDNNNVNINGVFNAIENFRDINMASKDYALDFPGNNRIGIGNTNSTNSNTNNTDEDVEQFNNGESSPLQKNDNNVSKSRTQELTKIKRYDSESKFFELLEIEEPFLHQKISDKIKYFDPAFHSVSPEGFNARLTFLQQCSRQGPTCGASDVETGNNTANNLAFGRPPVCILRLGDFYYTRIIIQGITIDYGDTMWDLNAEGIGVMPMIADITISFTYIGGSSLSGPISRLQNAVSFNMYANTEVYDNRAELAEYDDNGNITKFAPYYPSK